MNQAINQYKPDNEILQILENLAAEKIEEAIKFAEQFYKNNQLLTPQDIVTNIHLSDRLARIYSQQDTPKKAIEYAKKGIELAESNAYTNIIARQYVSLSMIYQDFYIIDKAVELLDIAFEKANKFDQQATIPTILSNKASFLFLEGKLEEAIAIFTDLLNQKDKLDTADLLFIYAELSKCYIDAKNFDKAIECLNFSLDLVDTEAVELENKLSLALCFLRANKVEKGLDILVSLDNKKAVIDQSDKIKCAYLFVWATYYNLQNEYEKSKQLLIDMVKLPFTESHFDAFTMLISNHYELDNIDKAVEFSETFLDQSKKYYAVTINEKNEKFKLFLAFNEAENEAKKQQKLLNQETRYRSSIEAEKGKVDELLANLLPAKAVIELKETNRVKPKRFENASVLFARIDGLAALSKKVTPKELLIVINNCFSTFDELAEQYEIERIKTIGYSYMAISGAPVETEKHLHNLAEFAVKMYLALEELKKMGDFYKGLALRTGIQSGAIIAGIVGVKKFAYDIWGDCVNTAARMEAFGQYGKIHCTEDVFHQLKNDFSFENRGTIDVKGKGEMETYFLNIEA